MIFCVIYYKLFSYYILYYIIYYQGRIKLFYGRGLSTNVGHHGLQTRKNSKITPAATP